MKIVICNLGYSGYAAACWQALASMPGVDLAVYTPQTAYPYRDDILSGLNVKVLGATALADIRVFRDSIVAEQPDAIAISGWSQPAFKALAYDSRLQGVRKLVAMDSMWTGNYRQIAARWALRSFVNRLDGAIVAGERGRQYARWLGFSGSQIFPGIYGYDASLFNPIFEKRLARSTWPRSFCFVGRYVQIKGLETLLLAYQVYRGQVASPWELHCFGRGTIPVIGEGVVDHGFLQPGDLPNALAEQGVFVFPSLYEPWGVALAEAAGTGMPLICSDAVASGIDLVRNLYNGIVFPAGNVRRLTDALVWMHEHVEVLPELGRRSQFYAGAYTPEVWAARWLEACSRGD